MCVGDRVFGDADVDEEGLELVVEIPPLLRGYLFAGGCDGAFFFADTLFGQADGLVACVGVNLLGMFESFQVTNRNKTPGESIDQGRQSSLHKTSNERINGEIRRRTDAVGIFLRRQAAIHSQPSRTTSGSKGLLFRSGHPSPMPQHRHQHHQWRRHRRREGDRAQPHRDYRRIRHSRALDGQIR